MDNYEINKAFEEVGWLLAKVGEGSEEYTRNLHQRAKTMLVDAKQAMCENPASVVKTLQRAKALIATLIEHREAENGS